MVNRKQPKHNMGNVEPKVSQQERLKTGVSVKYLSLEIRHCTQQFVWDASVHLRSTSLRKEPPFSFKEVNRTQSFL